MPKTDFFSQEYIQSRSEQRDSCWNWIGQKDKDGYGQFRRFANDKWHKAHRVSFESAGNKIPLGFEVAHTCHNKSCVNPNHLITCLHVVNVRMTLSKAGGKWERAKRAADVSVKHDKKGHSMSATSKLFGVDRSLVSRVLRQGI